MTTNGDTHGLRDTFGVEKREREVVLNRAVQVVMSQVVNAFSMSRRGTSLNGDARRNIDHECGYPEDIKAEVYQKLYDRDPIAARVVEVLPRESWQVQPSVYESEDPDEATAFEAAWDALGSQLRGEQSHYRDEEGSPVYDALLGADIASGVTGEAVVLIGINDGLKLSQPAGGVVEGTDRQGRYALSVNAEALTGRRLLYLTVLPGSLVEVAARETNTASPRFNQPTGYKLTLETGEEAVHWTRVVPVSERDGISRMQRVYNRLYDLQKIYGADAEGFWRNGVMKLFFESQEDENVDAEEMRDVMERMMNGLQQFMYTGKLTAKGIAPAVADPNGHVQAHLEAICIQLGIPKRIFMGSERGELASSQDDAAWNDRLKARQQYHITPRVIVPFVDRLILLGVLPKPEAGYSVWWPDLTSQTPAEKAAIMVQRVAAWTQFVTGGMAQTVAPVDFATKFDSMTDEEALSMLTNSAAEQERELAPEVEDAAPEPAAQPEPTEVPA